MTEMDKLVEVLRSKKFGSEEEVEAYLKANREKKKEKEPNKFIFNDMAASIVYPNGFVVTIGKQGGINWAYNSKKIEEGTVTPIIDQSDLQQCLEHIMGLHLKEKHDLKKAVWQWQQAKEGCTRWVKNDTKRAFISGIIHGKKLNT